MDLWAAKATATAGDERAKALALYEGLAGHARARGPLAPGELRTASQAFAALSDANTSLYCADYALLYVSGARAAGMRAYLVYVLEPADAQTTPHVCAGVAVDGKLILVDVAFFWFGAPHKRFLVLDDLEAVAVYVGQLPGTERSRLACRLAPRLPLTQLNLFEKLIAEERLDEARAVFARLRGLDLPQGTIDYAQGCIALLAGDAGQAVDLASRAITKDPRGAPYHVLLGRAYAQAGRLVDAARAFQDALRCPMAAGEAAELRRSLTETNRLAAAGHYDRGLGMLTHGDWRGALASCNAAIEAKADFAAAYVLRGSAKATGGDRASALADFKRALELDPTLTPRIAAGLFTAGCSDYDRHSFADALDDFRRAQGLGMVETTVYLHIWLVRSRMGERWAADQELLAHLEALGSSQRSGWLALVGRFLIGRCPEHELLRAAADVDKEAEAQRRCQALFYAAARALVAGDEPGALRRLQESASTGARAVPEFANALADMRCLEGRDAGSRSPGKGPSR